MYKAWLTPDELPETLACVRVFLPDGEAYGAALRGALHLLALAYNWEEHGTETPEDVAQLWIDANNETFKWRACMEAGLIMFFAVDGAPDGYLYCDGDDYDPDDYPELFDAIGYFYGGSSPGNFNIPNLRNRFIQSTWTAAQMGDTGGLNQETLTVSQIPGHNHSVDASIILAAPGALPVYGPAVLPLYNTNNAGGGQEHNNLPKYMRLLPVISTGRV